MSQSPANSAQSGSPDPAAVFGPNEWLVDELYQRYLEDKNSVDPAWWEFFADFKPDQGGSPGNGGAGDQAPAQEASGTAQQSAAQQAPAQQTTTQPTTTQPTTSQPAPASTTAAAPSGSTPPPAAPPTKPEPPQKPITKDDVHTAPAQPLERQTELPKPPPVAAAQRKEEAPAAEDTKERLRGPAARVVTNMEASLEVPTATSVRDIPAKLLIDNRIVINSNLARARGGKVSFTHIIGFALVQALKKMPEMNYAYTEVDGKPAVLKPAQINLGIAIDLVKDDGSRQLLVPSIKDCGAMDFAQFWAAYEDVVRRARGGKLGIDDFAGTTISLTNPGTIGTVHSVPRL
ncbi:MAG TPA: 2-oxo acid dehydrogenase subunit E2, partial [Actinomycetales bacterium]|nr:2-oxo acid dehydrogenase subunit E2 [Actinomycetales bacterium]